MASDAAESMRSLRQRRPRSASEASESERSSEDRESTFKKLKKVMGDLSVLDSKLKGKMAKMQSGSPSASAQPSPRAKATESGRMLKDRVTKTRKL